MLDLFSQIPDPPEEDVAPEATPSAPPKRAPDTDAQYGAARGDVPPAGEDLLVEPASQVREPGYGRGAPRGAGPARGPIGAGTGFTYSVTQLNSIVRELLESACPPVWVSGEVTGWKRHPSGHCYFSLRDRNSQVRCVMWRTEAQRLPTDPDEGMEVRALGAVTLYEKRGEFQLVVRELEGSGRGGLWRLAFEKLHAKLATEGLLAPERKRALPRFPRAVGVVTSQSGAVLHDILHVIERRAPWTRVVFCPARVQGDGAAADVARAIVRFGRSAAAVGVDVLIVGRGGGSKDDLWAFNDETLARAIAGCPVPVISAVGHETDVTIADLIADYRAPTPSAAAEAAVPDGRALERRLADAHGRLERALRRSGRRARDRAARAAMGLEECMVDLVRRRRERLGHAGARLDALSPLSALRRGYAVPLSPEGRLLRRAAEFQDGSLFRLRVSDGTVPCRVDGAPEPPPVVVVLGSPDAPAASSLEAPDSAGGA